MNRTKLFPRSINVNSPKRRLVAGAFALTLVAAACGSDSEGGSTEPATDSTEATADEAVTETTEAAADEPAAGGTVSGTLIGAGASSQAAGMQGWQAGFQGLNSDATIEYDAIGSGGGRELFLSGGSDFAGSDAALKDEEFELSKERCVGEQGAINLPHYISPIAIPYNLPSVDATLNLTPEVVAGIFANTITNWNDPAIVATNEGVELPDLNINPVHRSDESGTSENFTDYMSQSAPAVWTFGEIEIWDDGPGGGEGAQGTSGVVAAVEAGEGSIGYADASQIGSLPAAAVGVGDGFVEFSPEAAGRVVDASERNTGRNEFDFAIEVNRTPDSADVYPIALVSYHIVCLEYPDQETVDLIKAFMTYVGSEQGQADSAAAAGSAPISPEVRADMLKSIDAISVGA